MTEVELQARLAAACEQLAEESGRDWEDLLGRCHALTAMVARDCPDMLAEWLAFIEENERCRRTRR